MGNAATFHRGVGHTGESEDGEHHLFPFQGGGEREAKRHLHACMEDSLARMELNPTCVCVMQVGDCGKPGSDRVPSFPCSQARPSGQAVEAAAAAADPAAADVPLRDVNLMLHSI
ncbi:hypothetical protein BHM03_00024085 [Ensete ventricosum]|nr:hypothetical protein BHM03_00024085 [Ensete ventricosum]